MRRGFAGALALVTVVALTDTVSAATSEWYVRRNASNQLCSVQRADSQPLLGRYFSEHDTRKEACEFAKARYSRPARDVDECPGFSRSTADLCRIEGVSLPQ